MIQWTDAQTELRNSVVEWSGRLNDTAEAQSDKENLLKMWQVVREMGVLSLPIKSEYGGLEQDILTTLYVLESFGRHCHDSGFSFAVSSHIVSTSIPIQKFGNETQKYKYLPDLCSGKKIGAHAISEVESGSDAWNMKTHARKADNGYILNGNKTFVSNGPVADTFIVYARTSDTAGTLGGFTAFILDSDTAGFSRGNPMKKMGLNTSVLCDLFFDDCYLTADRVLGKEGQGFSIFNYVMKWEVLCSFIINVGEMEQLLSRCIEYSKARKQYGEPICKYQAVSHKIADMKISLETAKAMLYKAAFGFQKGTNITVDLAIAKVVTSENFVKSALDALQIFGGHGYMEETGIEKYVRNSVASKIYSGTSEIQRNTIASMLGL
jgi:alkylation response protein AidB-like acyl-CoA dehydrogenase